MKKILSYLVSTLVFNTAIAGLLTLLMPGGLFWHNFIYSQCIGLSVLALNVGATVYVKNNVRRWVVRILTMPLSVAVGMTLAFAISGVGSWGDQYTWLTMTIGLFFSLIGGITLLLSERIDMEVEQRRLLQSESGRREIEANLRMLQAQIEPHFLFNTLANVSSLIDHDPALAKRLLERLNDWLRVALVRARSDSATLDDELDMLENYLQILKIRFGERLRWAVDAAEDARAVPFPPMLLQPLVENAVRHGIEPKIGGGEIVIRAHIAEGVLHCEVSDDGVGIEDACGNGAGIANVRDRLATLFGAQGRLSLHNGAHGGTVATLELPAGS
jgi:LytS/YehU family sensor histidine kinase